MISRFVDFHMRQPSRNVNKDEAPLPPPLPLTRYHNGDMNSQTFFLKAEYDTELPPDAFTQELLVKKK